MNKAKETDVADEVASCLGVDAVKLRASIRSTRIIDALVAHRCALNMSQSAVAKLMSVSTSTVCRLEDSCDDDIRFGDIKKYAAAVNLDMSMLLVDSKLPLAGRIKHCAFMIYQFLQQLTDLAKKSKEDKDIIKGINDFRSQVLLNFMVRFASSGAEMPIIKCNEDSGALSASRERSSAVAMARA